MSSAGEKEEASTWWGTWQKEWAPRARRALLSYITVIIKAMWQARA